MKQAMFLALTASFVTGLFVSPVLFVFGALVIYDGVKNVLEA